MRNALILLFVGVLQANAIDTYSQKTRLSLNFTDTELTKVLDKIEVESQFFFLYNEKLLDAERKVNINENDQLINVILDDLFKGTDVKYSIVDRKIILAPDYLTSESEQQQQKRITGTVTDKNGAPLAGVNVIVTGTTQGTLTDNAGKYTIDIPQGAKTLHFTFIGMETQEVIIGLLSQINVTMAESAIGLEEVVVIGYGTVKKSDLTGAVSSLKSKDITATPTSNALQSLQGKVSGVDLVNTSGQAGNPISILVRGERSLKAGNEPLIMVDGIAYGSIIDINPSDIESIEVLKDASSTAIYGTRGANGVILITTKRGRAGKTLVSFNTSVGPIKITAIQPYMNASQFVAYKREAYRNKITNQYVSDQLVFTQAELDLYNSGVDVNIVKDVVQTGLGQNYEFSISHGNEKIQNIQSFGYLNQKGIFKDDNFQRFNFRTATDYQLLKNFKIGTSISFDYKIQNTRKSLLQPAYDLVPLSILYNEDGQLNVHPCVGYSSETNPLLDLVPGAYVDNTLSERIFGILYMNWNITKDLSFRTTLGVDVNQSRQGIFKGALTKDGFSGGGINLASKTSIRNFGLTWENVLTYSKNLNNLHDIQFMMGTSTILSDMESTIASGKDQPYDGNSFNNLASLSKQIIISSPMSAQQAQSFFGRINYKLMDKYLITATLRSDGISVFAPGHKWGYFPSVALAWKINEENFIKSVDAVSNLKLRLSWGESGQSISPYQTNGLLAKSVYSFNGAPAYGFYPGSMTNLNLSWETTEVYDAGLDFGIFNNRLSGSIDVYQSYTHDILMPCQISPTNGFTNVMQNIGKTKNFGIDILVSSLNVKGNNFTWSTDLTVSHNKEQIVELASGATKDEANGWFVGQPFQVFYNYKKIGIWQTNEIAEAAVNGQVPGQIKVLDADGSGGPITPQDRILYNRRPAAILGMNNSFTLFKNFEFSFYMYARLGQIISYDYYGKYAGNGLSNQPDVDYWTPENPTNDFMRPDKSINTIYTSTLPYVDGSFFKVRDITLSYNLPTLLLSKVKISNLRVYATANNFITISKLKDYDPEAGGSNTFPMTKRLILGVSLGF